MRHLTYANVMATAALFLSLAGGTALAAKLITGKQIKDRSITGRDVRTNTLTGKQIKDRSITGRDVKSNTLTGRVIENLSGRDIQSDSLDGTDIAENQLGTVPRASSASQADLADRATRADSAGTADALAGARVARVNFARPANSEAAVLDLGGLRLRAACGGNGGLTVLASTTSGPAWARSTGTMQSQNNPIPFLLEDDDFRTGELFSVLPSNADNVAGDVVYLGADGSTVTVTFLAEQGVAAARGFACLFAGTAVQAGA